MTPAVDLLASYWTISAGLPHTDREYSPFDFKDRVQSAASVGFKGFGIWHADLEHILDKYRLKEMKQILDDCGIQHVELEFLTDWFLNGERKKLSDIRKKRLLEAAAVPVSYTHLDVYKRQGSHLQSCYLRLQSIGPQLDWEEIDATESLCAKFFGSQPRRNR